MNPGESQADAAASSGLDKLLLAGAALLLLTVLYSVVVTPLSMAWQAGTGAAAVALAVFLRRRGSHRTSLLMMGLSVAFSTRYLYWRLTNTLPIGAEFNSFDLMFASGLVAAEIYAYVVLIMGYFQVLWPLHRKPVPLPADPGTWPTVDIYIPSYNEPLEVVRPTILAAMDIDWPRDKLRVYVLDDGRRENFKQFCEEVGVTHLIRSDNKHAKAGNINAAMKKTKGDYIAIFDCDHIPTRSFLQMTLGTMIAEPRMALVQTPHHFFSPDPFERNLRVFRRVPNEGELFYGLLQDGNDFWNATFFCGSCAVIRRTAMEEIGGIAVETVTEDAHTALRLHSRGWHSSYINIPQAAGLATESLSAHVGQRIRWARGMAQIFRVDNPFLMKGLDWGQRLCYANAMLHFFNGFARLVFLTSPLAFLLFNAEMIRAQGLMIFVYAAPHVVLAILTNSRLQGRYRHSFWAEVYETVLAVFIIVPTTLAVINPKLGKFNVTAKGGLVDRDYFDGNIARPYYLLYLLNAIGFLVAGTRLLFGDPLRADTVTLNMVWTFYNLLITGAALCVASETQQVRRSVRVRTQVPVWVRKPGEETVYETETIDLSSGGAALQLPAELGTAAGEQIEVAMMPMRNEVWIGGVVRRAGSKILTLEFDKLTLEQERHIVYTLYGRADAWLKWRGAQNEDRPLRALFEVGKFSMIGTARFSRWSLQQIRLALRRLVGGSGPATAAALLAALTTLCALQPRPALAADGATDVVFNESQRHLTLESMGQRYPMRLQSVFGQASLPLAVRQDQVITRATLHLLYAHSPSLIPQLSHLNVLVDDELAATIPMTAATVANGESIIELNPNLFGANNQIRFEAVQHYVNGPDQCEDPAHSSLWSIISNRSYVDITVAPLSAAPLLSQLPRPFFDSADQRPLTLPVSFLSAQSKESLTAATIVASWFGALADYRGAQFPALINALPAGHGVVLRSGSAMSDRLGPAPTAPRLRVITHPDQPKARLLLIEAPDEAGLLTAAQALVLGAYSTDSDTALVQSVELPEPSKRDAAPHWINPDLPVTLRSLSSDPMSVRGLTPGPISTDFRLPPDIYFLESTGAKLDLRYRYSPVTSAGSSLSILINDGFLGGLVLSRAGQPGLKSSEDKPENALIYLPASRLNSQNRLTLQYQFRRNVSKPCEDFNNQALGGSVDPDSELQFGKFARYALWPDLGRMRDGGLPFSLYPDLSQSALLVPDSPDDDVLTALMTFAGHIGHMTGMAALRVTVDGVSAAATLGRDHDLLLIGRSGQLPVLDDWKDDLPLAFGANGAQLRSYGAVARWQASIEGRDLEGALHHAGRVLTDAGRGVGAFVGAYSPYSSDRAVVIMTAGNAGRLSDVAAALVDPARNQFIEGDLSLLHGAQVSGYHIVSQYGLGSLPWHYLLRRWISLHPYLVGPMILGFAVLAALMLFSLLRRRAARRVAGNH